MYAGGNVAILQFHAKGEWKPFRSSLEFADDADSMFHISHMVVGHFINEEWPTIEVPHSPISPVSNSRCASGLRLVVIGFRARDELSESFYHEVEHRRRESRINTHPEYIV